MLVVAFKYYQQRMTEEWNEQEEVEEVEDEMQENPKKGNNQAHQGNGFHHRQRSTGPVSFEVNKERKVKRAL